MPAAWRLRILPALMAIAVAVALTGCGFLGSSGGAAHTAAYQQGFRAGREARHHHHFRHHHGAYQVQAFCIKTAIADIQHKDKSIVDWTEGFETGCRSAG